MQIQLPIEVMRAIEKQRLTPRQLKKVLDVPQPRVSELIDGKISRMTADLLAKYLYRLGREVEMKTKTSAGPARRRWRNSHCWTSQQGHSSDWTWSSASWCLLESARQQRPGLPAVHGLPVGALD